MIHWLQGGNTLRSDEDRLKLNELMALCTTLQSRVLDLEKTKTTQANEIASLKRRVKKLEKKRSSRTHKLKRLYKVGLTARLESSGDEEDLGEDASKQGSRINAIDADEDINLVNVQDDVDNEMFDVDALNDEVVFVAEKNENVVEKVVDAAQVSTAATTVTITTKEITLAQALEALKTSKPKVKGIVFQEPGKSTTTTTISSQQSQDKGKGIMIEETVKPIKKKDQISFDEVALKLQAEFDKEERLAREKVEKEKEANIALIEEWDDIQAKIDADYQLAERMQAQEQEELSDAEKATLFQQLLEKRRKHFAGKSAKEKRNKPPTQAQQRKIMYLVEGSSKRAGEELEQESTKKQKVDEDKDTIELQSLMEVIPDEEEVAIDDVPLATKSLKIVDWKIHKEGKKSYYQIVRDDRKSQMYMIFIQMLKSFNREDLEDLYKLVKARYRSTRLVESMDYLLWNDLKIMFEPHVEDAIWRNQQGYKVLEWKLYDSYDRLALWKVIKNGATFPKTAVVEGVEKVMPITSNEDKAQRRLEVKARSTLMMGIPNVHQLKFNSIKDAKLLLQAVEKIFDEKLSQEDVNQKLIRSLSPEWKTHVVVWRNKAELETMSMDDLYNNLKVYEPEVKGMSSLSSSTKNIAFMSSSNNNTSSSNEAVNAAHRVTTAST
ncbi:hypothetical protein Tco_0373566 [Tanacetum coccineum]